MHSRRIKRLINCVFPDSICNLRCHYCYIGQQGGHVKQSSEQAHSVEEVLTALSNVRLGGCCHMNMCAAGETLLVPNIIELAKGFIEDGHVVTIVTNGLITNKIDELCNFPDSVKEYLFIKVSFHYLQMKEKNLLPKFWENIEKIKKAKISYTVELTVNDESVPYISEIHRECDENLGVDCHVIESREQDMTKFPRLTQMGLEEHLETWGSFHSELFEFQQTIWGEKRTEFCYAGDWVCSIDLKSGNVVPCFGGGHLLDNIYRNIEKPIQFNAIGHQCPWGHCYAAYALLTHGAIPDFTNVTYAEERNRICKDGSRWLQPSLEKSFSNQLSIENEKYNSLRMQLTDFVMGQVYDNYNSDNAGSLVAEFNKFFLGNKIKKAAIYGAGKVGKGVYNLLRKCNVEVVCFIDQNENIANLPIPCVSNKVKVENVDLIIVTVFNLFYEIEETLKQSGNENIINILSIC